jgi:hypothetical protein
VNLKINKKLFLAKWCKWSCISNALHVKCNSDAALIELNDSISESTFDYIWCISQKVKTIIVFSRHGVNIHENPLWTLLFDFVLDNCSICDLIVSYSDKTLKIPLLKVDYDVAQRIQNASTFDVIFNKVNKPTTNNPQTPKRVRTCTIIFLIFANYYRSAIWKKNYSKTHQKE